MANSQTTAFRKIYFSTKMHHGVSVYTGKASNPSNAVLMGALTFESFGNTKGRCINSSAARAAQGRHPWKGHGDILKRDKVIFPKTPGRIVRSKKG